MTNGARKMPVFQETSNAARDLRILSSRALPLPRLSPPHKSSSTASTEDQREVVVIGVRGLICNDVRKLSLTQMALVLGWPKWSLPHLIAS